MQTTIVSTAIRPTTVQLGLVQSIEQIGEAEAIEMLKSNRRNRTLNDRQVQLLAGQIAAGQWKLNGESIKFTADNRLLDGQHRLKAILIAKKPIQTVVMRGLSEDVFDTIDTGHRRTVGAILGIMGEKNYNHLARALNILHSFITEELPHVSAVSAVEAEALLRANPGIRDSIALSHGIKGITSCGSAAGFHYIFSSKDPVLATVFIKGLRDGFDPARYPAFHHLRDRLILNKSSRAKLDYRDINMLFAKAWNKTRLGLASSKIHLVTGETFPDLQ